MLFVQIIHHIINFALYLFKSLKGGLAMGAPLFIQSMVSDRTVCMWYANWKIKRESNLSNSLIIFVIPARLERATHSLEGCCSIQLSYGTLFRLQKYVFFQFSQPQLILND